MADGGWRMADGGGVAGGFKVRRGCLAFGSGEAIISPALGLRLRNSRLTFPRRAAHRPPPDCMGPPQGDGHEASGSSDRRVQLPPPPPASWPAAGSAKQLGGAAATVAAHVPSWSGFDEDFEVHLPGREHTTFFVRVAGRELAARNGVAVVLHGVREHSSLQRR